MEKHLENGKTIEGLLKNNDLEVLYDKQIDYLKHLNSPHYEDSMLNPERASEKWSELGPMYSTFQSELTGIYEDISLGKEGLRLKKEDLANKLYKFFQSKGSLEEAEEIWKDYLLDSAEEKSLDSVRAMVDVGKDNPYEEILFKSNKDSFNWLGLYGLPINEIEVKMAKFWYSIPQDRLIKMANIIVDAFLHGFISQSRDRRQRTRVRFYYQVGQEALAKQVVLALKDKGLQAVVTKPKSLYPVNQHNADHQFDKWFLLDEELYDVLYDAHKKAMSSYEEELKDTCGMIGIDQFGSEPFIVTPSEKANTLTSESTKWFRKLANKQGEMEAQWIKPSEISFCKVAFPNMLIGEEFEEIFEDFFQLNSAVSEPYELLQQKLIDGLDKCESARIKGYNGNDTDLTVKFWPIMDSEKETKFLNCGGDLNIPYGEIFTTPKLSGTNGVFHVKEISLRGVFYNDLRLEFKDGLVSEYDCGQGKKYLKENLLHPDENLTIGEFAIGTNTMAYSIAEKYGIGPRLPILIYEKMGPHIAIGDPCFVHSEDAAIFNMYDKKEMTCRANEVTMERKNNPNVYFGKHIDITLPYKEVEYLKGVKEDGTEIFFIKEGRFVLEGVEGLNEGLK